MVQQFVLKWHFAVAPNVFFKLFFSEANYVTQLHVEFGDTNVDVSEWIPVGIDDAQRIVYVRLRLFGGVALAGSWSWFWGGTGYILLLALN
jgi:hypothetical protein